MRHGRRVGTALSVGRALSAIAVAAALPAAARPAAGQEWTRFRGPNGSGLGDGDAIGAKWTAEDHNWKVELPGGGHGSPVVWGEKVFLLCGQQDGTRVVACVQAADGKIAWTHPCPGETFRMHSNNSYATSTPAVDKDRVYAYWPGQKQQTLLALDHDGKEVWKLDLGPFRSAHGAGTSPIVHDDVVVLANDQQGKSFLIAVDAKTGTTRWKLDRPGGQAAYGTPCVFAHKDGRADLVFTSTSSGMTGVDAKTGEVRWQVPGAFPQRCVSSPVAAPGLAMGACGVGGGGKWLMVVRPGADKQAEEAYRVTSSAPYVPTPLVKDGLLFLWSDQGTVSCLRAATGEPLWQQSVGGRFYASPVCVADRLYCVSTAGEVVVVRAAETFEILARNALGAKTQATPAVAGGRMYLRTGSRLICVGGKK